MCYICSCFAWGLDLVQRLITFGLACILSCAIFFGLTIAIIAGIAYGYNYSMAEFITFTRSDVTVFMRRGQFGDKPDLGQRFRRTGEEDLFTSNATNDYEDQRPRSESKPLADTWLKSQDTRKYAEILTRYSPRKGDMLEQPGVQEPTRVLPTDSNEGEQEQTEGRYRPTESSIISIVPNPLIPTVSWRSGSSEIMMRNFKPMQDFTSINRGTELPDTLFPPVDQDGSKSINIINPKEMAKGSVDDKLRDDFHKSYVPMRVWGTTTRPVISDEVNDDVDEDNIVYKPV
ncbi:uncharacterized protein LOC113502152 [Trichoplusia ni]|uniref:Uncharacterized protein LOC113502152 n=1 Tax=Trichoplusia ni TaxID=7111 RepID=A0A7E5WGT6_TRINI|nr:uncharacterized protein LOC113502152 [Trichoplusia ni]XP_026739356.1 uncharacterized protein LOC113502152 [Trichoplusia ni]